MTVQLIDPRQGYTYKGLTEVAKDSRQGIRLYIWKNAKRWRYVLWDLNTGNVDQTGPALDTKRDAMDRAEYVATRLWDMPVSAMTI